MRLLDWNLEYSKDIVFYKDLQRRGKASPLDELKPARDEIVAWFLQTFRLLESSRQPSGTIPLSEILIFSDYFDLMCSLDQFVRIITAMDEAVIQYQIKVRKKHDRSNQSKRRNR